MANDDTTPVTPVPFDDILVPHRTSAGQAAESIFMQRLSTISLSTLILHACREQRVNSAIPPGNDQLVTSYI